MFGDWNGLGLNKAGPMIKDSNKWGKCVYHITPEHDGAQAKNSGAFPGPTDATSDIFNLAKPSQWAQQLCSRQYIACCRCEKRSSRDF